MIRSFKCKETEALFQTGKSKHFGTITKVAIRKLTYLNAAALLTDLAVPPNNKLHALDRDRLGQHAISINDQFRICFVWTPQGPEDVEITDYH